MSKIIFILPEFPKFNEKKLIFCKKTKIINFYLNKMFLFLIKNRGARMSENMSVDSKQEIGAKDPVELRSLPTRKYLDETVVPLLLEGLSILTKVG